MTSPIHPQEGRPFSLQNSSPQPLSPGTPPQGLSGVTDSIKSVSTTPPGDTPQSPSSYLGKSQKLVQHIWSKPWGKALFSLAGLGLLFGLHSFSKQKTWTQL